MIKLIATCDSDTCAFRRTKIGVTRKKGRVYDRVEPKYIGPQVKHVCTDTMDCPDCRSALFWTRIVEAV